MSLEGALNNLSSELNHKWHDHNLPPRRATAQRTPLAPANTPQLTGTSAAASPVGPSKSSSSSIPRSNTPNTSNSQPGTPIPVRTRKKAMPPRKKIKGSAKAASAPPVDEDAMDITQPTLDPETTGWKLLDAALASRTSLLGLEDRWTDEQESSLFTAIGDIGKPAGMHKRIRMFAISQRLRNHGYDPDVNPHIRIPGIWAKLGSLYNLQLIDQMENHLEERGPRWNDWNLITQDEKGATISGEEDGYLELAMGRRFQDPTKAEEASPPQSPQLPVATGKKRKRGDTVTAPSRASTVDTEDATPSKQQRAGRSTKKAAGRTAESSRSRQPSKDTNVEEETVDEEEEEDIESEEEEEVDEEEAEKSTPKMSKAAAKAKGRGGTTRKSARNNK